MVSASRMGQASHWGPNPQERGLVLNTGVAFFIACLLQIDLNNADV
jgi:hypothetical protein